MSEPLPPPSPATDTDLLLPGRIRRQWKHRSSVSLTDIAEQWTRLRSLANRAGAGASGKSSDRDVLLLRELASAPLPDPPWLRPWHLAVLATALRTALRTAPGSVDESPAGYPPGPRPHTPLLRSARPHSGGHRTTNGPAHDRPRPAP
ncbi:hypothetical protein AB0O01_10255 [Streptomyces sp. NPDC093252]|uniref:hypothetical protein n=1 Tax=Streptomyces sp. NPDC093252 TaxID=3154980 RepID=UPI003429CFE5